MSKTMALVMAMFLLTATALATMQQGGDTAAKPPAQDRVSGTIARSNMEKSTLVVKEHRSSIEKTVIFSPTTKWTKGSKPADMKEFKDGSRVICIGKFNDKGELHAARIDLE